MKRSKNKCTIFQLAQVQSLAQVRTTLNHHQSFTDKLVEDALFTSPASPTHGATVNQLLRRAAAAHRRERRISSEPDSDHKRVRADHIIGNNNNNNIDMPPHQQPPQVAPTDFSPSAMKNSMNSINSKPDIEGNGISSTERDSKSPSPTNRLAGNNNTFLRLQKKYLYYYYITNVLLSLQMM